MPALLDTDMTNANLRIRDMKKEFILFRSEECPFTTMCRKGTTPKNSLLEWPVKLLPTPSDSAVAENTDLQAGEIANNEANKGFIQGRIQKGRVGIGVGDLAETLGNEYGTEGKSMFADNVADALINARENMELTALKDGDSVAGVGTGTAPKTRGLGHWVRNSAQADLPVNINWRTPTGNLLLSKATASVITEDDCRTMLRTMAQTTRRKVTRHAFVSPTMKDQFSNFTLTATQSTTVLPLRRFVGDQGGSELKVDIQSYASDHGRVMLHTHYSLPAAIHMLVCDMDMVEMRIARAPRLVRLEDRGGGPTGFVDYILALCCLNPSMFGKATTAAA